MASFVSQGVATSVCAEDVKNAQIKLSGLLA